MAGVTQTLKLGELDLVVGELKRVEDVLPLLQGIGSFLESTTQMRFQTNIGPDGKPWKRSLGAAQRGMPTLVQSTNLRQSLTRAVVTLADIRLGTNVPYAAIHQFGGVIRAKGEGLLTFMLAGIGWRSVREVTMPARPFLGVSDSDMAGIRQLGEDFVRGPA